MASECSNLAGALVIAVVFDWGLLGILLIQTYIYYLTPEPVEQRVLWKRILVYAVLVLELAQVGVTTEDAYRRLSWRPEADPTFPRDHIQSCSDDDATNNVLNEIHTLWLSIPVFGGLVGGLGQFFFAYRIWTICKAIGDSVVPPIIISVLGAASVTSAFVSAGYFSSKSVSTVQNLYDLKTSVGIWNGFGAICDLVIALSMPYYLLRSSRTETYRAKHTVVVRIVGLIVETGIFTAAFAILHFVLYYVGSSAFLVPGLTISKVYANTILVLQNNRIKITNQRDSDSDESVTEERETETPRRPVFVKDSESHPGEGASVIRIRNGRLVFQSRQQEGAEALEEPAPSYQASSSSTRPRLQYPDNDVELNAVPAAALARHTTAAFR